MLTVTPETFATFLAQPVPDDRTYAFVGDFGPWRYGKPLPVNVTFDMTRATATNWYLGNGKLATITRLTIQGGRFKTNAKGENGLRFDGGAFISVLGARFTGPGVDGLEADGYGLRFMGCSDVAVTACVAIGLRSAITMNDAMRVLIADNSFSGLAGDAVIITDGADVEVRRNIVAGHILGTSGVHPDGFQFSATKPGASRNLLIVDNTVASRSQGVFLRGYNGARHAQVTIARNVIRGDQPNGIGASNVDGLMLADNVVATLPGATWGTRINLTDVTGVQRSGNLQCAYGRYPTVTD